MGKNRKWNNEENNKLKEIYRDSSKEELENVFERNYSAIQRQASTLGLKRKRTMKSNWTNEELNFLKENYNKLSTKSISGKINKNENQIRNMRNKLNLKPNRVIKKWDDNSIVEICKSQGYKLIDKEIGKFNELRVNILCENGHISNKDFNSLRIGSKCNKCLGSERLTIDYIRQEFENENYILLDDIYVNAHTGMNALCNKGHRITTTWNNFQQGSRCKECSIKIVAENQRLSYKDVVNEFESRNCILVSKEYVNNQGKLEYICPHHPNEIQTTTFGNFKQGHGCKECQKEKLRSDRKFPYEDIVLEFKDRGFNIVSDENDYLNCFSELQFICEKHKEIGVQINNFANLKKSKVSICLECYRDITNGKYSPAFKGGISELKVLLRGIITDWKKESMRKSEYKCVLTGEKFDDIHHLYGFNLIVEETLSELKLPKLSQVKDYTDGELDLIKNSFAKIHSSYPLGVCLSHKVHVLYHKNYGYGSNTPEQFEEFAMRFTDGEFEEILSNLNQ